MDVICIIASYMLPWDWILGHENESVIIHLTTPHAPSLARCMINIPTHFLWQQSMHVRYQFTMVTSCLRKMDGVYNLMCSIPQRLVGLYTIGGVPKQKLLVIP